MDPIQDQLHAFIQRKVDKATRDADRAWARYGRSVMMYGAGAHDANDHNVIVGQECDNRAKEWMDAHKMIRHPDHA